MTINSKLDSWFQSIAEAEYFTWWGYSILCLTLIGLINIIFSYFRLWTDSLSIKHAKTLQTNGYKPKDVYQTLKGVVKIWSDAIIGRAAQGHPSGVSELDLILHHRYSSRGQWVDWIRGSCTTIGLFFTFFGLGLALKELGDALQLSKTVVESNELAGLLLKVKSVLPTMGTAFASSIAGIGASFLLGIFENVINTKKSNLGAILSELSMRWLEPGLLPMNDTTALLDISSAIKLTHQEIQDASSTHTQSIALLKDLAEKFSLFPEQNLKSWETVHQQLCSWIDNYFEKNKLIFDGMSKTWSENSERVEQTLLNAQESTVQYTEQFNEMSDHLQQNAGSLSEFMGKLTHDLEISAEHISHLSDAAVLFQDAQVESNSVISDSKVIQQQLLGGLHKVFEQVPVMTEAITEASSKTAASAERLETVILNSRMDGYINRLADLANLAEREKEAREQLFVVFDQLKDFGVTVGQLNQTVIDIGRTSSALKRAHESIELQIGGISRDTLLPILSELISQSVAESSKINQEKSLAVLERLASLGSRQEESFIKILEAQKRALLYQREFKTLLSSTADRKFGSFINTLKLGLTISTFSIGVLYLLMQYGPAPRVVIIDQFKHSSQTINSESTMSSDLQVPPTLSTDMKDTSFGNFLNPKDEFIDKEVPENHKDLRIDQVGDEM